MLSLNFSWVDKFFAKNTFLDVLGQVFNLFLVLSFVYLLSPTDNYQYVRINNNTQNIVVEYVDLKLGSECSKLHIIEKDTLSSQVFVGRFPSDLPNPQNTPDIQEGKRFVLEAYAYEWRAKNRFTGLTKGKGFPVYDVVAWRDTKGNAFSTAKEHKKENFNANNTFDCFDTEP